jgi:hypothetical protein
MYLLKKVAITTGNNKDSGGLEAQGERKARPDHLTSAKSRAERRLDQEGQRRGHSSHKEGSGREERWSGKWKGGSHQLVPEWTRRRENLERLCISGLSTTRWFQ